jgi:NitT/TauT family transport system substrate-binding protein
MSSGKYDIGQGNVVSIAAARMKGIPFVLIAPASLYNAKAPTSVLVVSKDSPVKTPADLSGKPVANLELRDIGTVGLDLWLAAAGLPPSTIQVVEIPGAEMGAALSRGTVAAAFMIEPFLSASMNENRILGLPYSAIADRFLIAAYFTTSDWLSAHKDTARKFQAALTETARWANSHHAESAQILEKWTKVHVSPTQTRVTYGETLDPKVIQPLLDAATKDAFLGGSIRAAVLMAP